MERVRVAAGLLLVCLSTAGLIAGRAGVNALVDLSRQALPWAVGGAGLALLLRRIGPLPRLILPITLLGTAALLASATAWSWAQAHWVQLVGLLGLLGGAAMALAGSPVHQVPSGARRTRIWSIALRCGYAFAEVPELLTVTCVLGGEAYLDLSEAEPPGETDHAHLFLRLWLARDVIVVVPRSCQVVAGDSAAGYAITWEGSFDRAEGFDEIARRANLEARREGPAERRAHEQEAASVASALLLRVRERFPRLLPAGRAADERDGSATEDQRPYLVIHALGFAGTVRLRRVESPCGQENVPR